jgi:hypothetical protein
MRASRDGRVRCRRRFEGPMRRRDRLPSRIVLGLLLGLLALGGCQESNTQNRVRPSPLPPGYVPLPQTLQPAPRTAEEQVQQLDEKLAVVAGEVITRRRLAREMRGRGPGQEEAAFERALERALLERARLLLFVKESQRSGITISEQRLDEVVGEALVRAAKEASETIGEPVTIEEWLAEQNLTRAEFRQKTQESLYYQAYMIRLLQGIGGPTRPMVDMVVAPNEVRRVYWSNPGAFDEKAGVRFAAFQLPLKRYLDRSPDLGFAEAEEQGATDARALAQAYGSGESIASIVRRFDLREGEWRAPRENEFADADSDVIRLLGEETAGWLFDSARRPGDSRAFADARGQFVLGIVEVRPGRRLPWTEVYDKIVGLHQLARQRRAEELRLIEILSTRNEVQPPALADALLGQSQQVLRELDRDPILAAARFR